MDEADSELAEALVPNTDNSDFDKLTHRLVRDSEAAEGGDDSDDSDFILTICVPPRSQQSNPPTTELTQRHLSPRIPLKSLFDYNVSSNGAGLDFCWKGGLKNLNRELAAYDLLCEDEDESVPDEDRVTEDGMDHAN
jgi:hypothetical protein